MTLVEALTDPARHDAIVAACVRLVEDEVGSKRGLTGATIRTAFAAFQRIRPGIVRAAVVRLLPDMAAAIDPHWQRAGADPDGYFARQQREVAQDLLAVSDRLAARSSNAVLVRLYKSLRGSAVEHVAAAVPRLPAVWRAHGGGASI